MPENILIIAGKGFLKVKNDSEYKAILNYHIRSIQTGLLISLKPI